MRFTLFRLLSNVKRACVTRVGAEKRYSTQSPSPPHQPLSASPSERSMPLRSGHEPTEALGEELKAHVGHEMGPIAKPEKITLLPQLPKTRSDKVRRVLKARAQGLPEGDLSTLEE